MPRDSERTLVAQIPEELHKEVRIAATRQGKTMRRFVIEALEEKLRKGAAPELSPEDIERQRQEALERIWKRFANARREPSVVDELITERREEARREADE